MAFARTWNAAYENSPLDSDQASTLGLQVRNLKLDIEQRLLVDHVMYPMTGYIAGDDGKHAQVTWKAGLAQPAIPAVAGDVVSFFDAGGALSTEDSSGFITHLGSEPSSLGDANQTLTVASGKLIGTTPTAIRTWKLPTTSVKSGFPIQILNFGVAGTGILIIQGSDGSTLATIDGGASAIFIAKQNTPVTGAHWKVIHEYGATGFIEECGAATGTILPGFLECLGQAVSRTTYAALFAFCGTRYGAGDGSTTFNLPDHRGRVSVGAGTGPGLTARTTGQTGGEESHVLSVAELAGHSHTEVSTDAANGVTTGAGAAAGTAVFNAIPDGGQGNGVGLQTFVTGGNAAHNNMQPYTIDGHYIHI